MALAWCALRRSASNFASVCGGQVRVITTVVNRPSLALNPSQLRPFVSGSFHSPTVIDQLSSEQKLVREIDSQINFASQITDMVNVNYWGKQVKEETIGSLPFRIEDDGGKTVTLTRDYKGEHIKILVGIPCEPRDDDDEVVYDDDEFYYGDGDDGHGYKFGDSEEEEDGGDGDEFDYGDGDDGHGCDSEEEEDGDDGHGFDSEEEERTQPDNGTGRLSDNELRIHLTVNVTKKSGLSLEFRCQVFHYMIDIYDVFVDHSGDSLKDQLPNIEGSDHFKDVADMDGPMPRNKWVQTVIKKNRTDDLLQIKTPTSTLVSYKLKLAFSEYLKTRVTNGTSQFLYTYMTTNKRRRRLLWLKDVKKFLDDES